MLFSVAIAMFVYLHKRGNVILADKDEGRYGQLHIHFLKPNKLQVPL